MGIYSDYLGKKMTFEQLTAERKKQLKIISALRENRDIIVYASDISNRLNAPISIDYSDILIFQDQLSNLKGKAIDVILETPGGSAESVEDIVRLIRDRYNHVGIIIPGTAKSAGTIFAMAGDEILMGTASSLGPIDAQIISPTKRYSADAFLEGLQKIKEEVQAVGKLNPAYIPILQNISPGEIQHCENAQNFSKKLVTQWLVQYKFKFWEKHSSTGNPVLEEEKKERAQQIADQLCKHSDWLTHGRSIKISDLEKMKLQIVDYSKVEKLNEAITRYYTLLRMTLESTNMYKIIETPDTQVQRFSQPNVPQPGAPDSHNVDGVVVDMECQKCKTKSKIFAKFKVEAKVPAGAMPFPKSGIFACGQCHHQMNVLGLKLQIEAQTGKKILP